MATEHQRIMDGTHAPTEEEIAAFIDEPARAAWVKLTRFLNENYDIAPEKIFDKKQGWDVRYRKSGKTLITLTPEKTAVRVLWFLAGRNLKKRFRCGTS